MLNIEVLLELWYLIKFIMLYVLLLNMLMRITEYPSPRSGQLIQCFAVFMFVKIISSEGATILPARLGPYILLTKENVRYLIRGGERGAC